MTTVTAPDQGTARGTVTPAQNKSPVVIFVEIFRLLLVIAGVIGGLEVGNHIGRDTKAPLFGIVLGALVTYVMGGIGGRLVNRGMRGAVSELRKMPAGEVFAGSVVGTTGLLLGLVAGFPLIALVHSTVDYPVIAAFAWVLCAFGIQLGLAKGREIVRAAGMSRLLERPDEPVADSALLVDTSSVMDRYLLVLGRSGLLLGGLLVPRFVVDEVRALSHGPDPVASRRARRGLESIDALQTEGVVVRITEDEVPEYEGTLDKTLALAQRLHVRVATCANDLVARAEDEGVDVLDLRRLTTELTPDHPPGERLVIDFVKEGRSPGQAVGYLPDGDMVVVNDASHLVGSKDVEVVVSSARQTSQGLLVFAYLIGDRHAVSTRATVGSNS